MLYLSVILAAAFLTFHRLLLKEQVSTCGP